MISRYKLVASFVAVFLLFGFILTFVAGPAFAAGKYSMIFIVKSLDNPFWDRMRAGAEKAGKDLDIDIKTLAPIKPYNVEEQLRFMEDGITQKVDAICVVPADSKGIVPGIKKANKAGIPVVTPNSRAYGGDVTTWTGAQNRDVGYDIAKYALKELGGKGDVIILEGTPGNQTAIDRKKGFDDAIAEHKGIKVLASQTAKYSRVEGMRVMENLVQRFPKIDLVIACNDEMALGAIEALDAAGRLSKTKVTGFDANNDALKSIAEGKMLATGDQRPDAQGYWGVVAAYCYLEGMPVPKDIYLPAPVISKSNIAEYQKK
jgi:ribose transport system substrate-binding protein